MAAGFVIADALFLSDPQLLRLKRWSDDSGIIRPAWIGTAAGALFLCAGAVAVLIAFEGASFANIVGLFAAVSVPAGLFVVIGGGLVTATEGRM